MLVTLPNPSAHLIDTTVEHHETEGTSNRHLISAGGYCFFGATYSCYDPYRLINVTLVSLSDQELKQAVPHENCFNPNAIFP